MKRALLACAVALAVAACNGQFRFDDQASAIDADASPQEDAPASGPDSSIPATDATADAVEAAPPHPGCVIDADCKLPSLHCDTVSGACVACTSDENCPTSQARRCDAALHRCVECGVDGDCNPDQKCEPTTRRCVTTCTSITGCNISSVTFCDVDHGFCIRCKTKVECLIAADAHVCDSANGMCVECVDDSDCPTGKHRCDRTIGKCAACVTSTDCPAATPFCDPSTRACVSG